MRRFVRRDKENLSEALATATPNRADPTLALPGEFPHLPLLRSNILYDLLKIYSRKNTQIGRCTRRRSIAVKIATKIYN